MLLSAGRLGCNPGTCSSNQSSSTMPSQWSCQSSNAASQASCSGRGLPQAGVQLLHLTRQRRRVATHAAASSATPTQQRQRHRGALHPSSAKEAAAAAAEADAAAPHDTGPVAPKPIILVEDEDPDGNAIVYQLETSEYEITPKVIDTDEILEDLDRVDVEASSSSRQVDVPATRLIQDPEELDLIGEGLPIVNGEEWPEVYWKALQRINRSAAVEVPQPHPKFSLQDMERIAGEGPRFEDVVLEHAERVYDPGPTPMNEHDVPVGEAYTYVPYSVLGDYRFDTEPNWLKLPQMDLLAFYHGLRMRNWTSNTYNPSAKPWRLQFFQCGYTGVSGWPGWRAVVTDADGSRTWVDMPLSGPDSFLRDYAAAAGESAVWSPKRTPAVTPEVAPEAVGYNQVFEQVFQAYEQRLPLEGVLEMCSRSAVPPGKYAYDCPGDKHLDVSWHRTANGARGMWVDFLMRPNLASAVQAVRWAINESGIIELKVVRDLVNFTMLPPVPKFYFMWNPNNAGPLYFLICLTAGVVIPSLRRSRILDIKTLEEDPGAAQEFARSKATARKEGLTGVEFKDIAGLDPILNEVLEVVEFLKDPKTFSKLGARPPKGILLEGDPGTGKTLLAKALAGEAMVPFYQMTGTEFTEGIVGLGAARVRDLFKRARVMAPCIIFVDELDALGLKRASGEGNANEEREQTLNQLLTEMDGFTPDTGVVFIGATNRADLLDSALMRPGRFDRKVRMPKPDTEGRYEILRLQLRTKQVAPDVDLLQLSRDLPGLVGADLANIINEAQLNAVRDGRTMLTKQDLYAGVDRFSQGATRPRLPTTRKLPVMVFAAKEAGVALVATELRQRHGRIEAVERVSIQPKGRSNSRTLFARGTDEEYTLITRGRLLDRIKVALAGAIAVRVVLGEDTNLAVAANMRAKRLAEKFVFYYGMSDYGITTWAKQPYSSDFQIGRNRPRKVVSVDAMDAYADWPTKLEEFRFDPPDPSDVTWHRYSDEVRRVVKGAYEEVWALLTSRKAALWAAIRELAARRELLGGEIRDIFDEYPAVPLQPDEVPKLDMEINTKGRDDVWPYGIEWLDDAYPVPYWARKQQEAAREKEAATAGAGAGGKGGSSGSR